MEKIFTLFLIFPVLIYAQFEYKSDFEKQVFEGLKKDSLQYSFFNSLLVLDSTMTVKKASSLRLSVDQQLVSFGKNYKKSDKKKVKLVYQKLHEVFLKKYDLYSFFDDIFKSGYYNCVTATALYTYAFEKLGIPYRIQEEPSHVFLVAYPNSHNIYLETTAPGALGFLTPKESEIKKIVNELIAYKIVSQEEVDAKGYLKFYEEYFYKKEAKDKKALVGMQYYNRAISNIESKKYDLVIEDLKKAKLTYKGPMLDVIYKNVCFLKADTLLMNNEDDIAFIYHVFSEFEIDKDYNSNNVLFILEKVVSNNDNSNDFIKNVADKFSRLEDEKLKKICQEYLYEYLAKSSYSNQENEEALLYCDKLYELNSKSKVVKDIVSRIAFYDLGVSLLDQEALMELERYSDKYAFVKENKKYDVSLGFLYSNISLLHFKNKEINEGLQFLKKFETLVDNKPKILKQVSKILISELYYTLGNYYYYKSQY